MAEMDDQRQLIDEIAKAEEPPCATFSPSAHDERECKHCGWTEEAHLVREAFKDAVKD